MYDQIVNVKTRNHQADMGGWQQEWRFKNGYGLSIIQTPFSYGNRAGNFEIAMLQYHEDGSEPVYTDLLPDVESITPDELMEWLEKVANFQP